MPITDMYTNGKYLEENPSWDAEDSEWKAEQIHKMIERNKLKCNSIYELGCGGGDVIRYLQQKIDNDSCIYRGYEISPQAYDICKPKEKDNLQYFLKDFLLEKDAKCDIIMLIDLIEHLENYHEYLRSIKDNSQYKILHIPLEFFAVSAIYEKLLINQRKKVGHLHYFTKDIALAMLEELDYEIVDYFYTPGYTLSRNYGFKDKLIKIPRMIFSHISVDLTARIFGGFSLMVLVK